MSALFLLIIVSVSVAVGFLIAFIWAVRSGQYDDRFTPAVRMLFDDTAEPKQNEQKITPDNTRER